MMINASENSRILIRPATAEDAEGILLAHYSAVHETASRDYPESILNVWSTPVNEARIEAYCQKALPVENTIVALRRGAIAGFGAIVPSANELRAVYVASDHSGAGVGSALLQRLEEMAQAAGCRFLQMDSSLTAEAFYRKHGYKVAFRGMHRLSSGEEMGCVSMRKDF